MGCERLDDRSCNFLSVAYRRKEDHSQKKRVNVYPFGLEHRGYNSNVNGVENNYMTFMGKEHEKSLGLDWHDFDTRMYDTALGRWMVIDPLAEEMRRFSPYAFAFNNPIYFIDPDGMMPIPTHTWQQVSQTIDDIATLQEVNIDNIAVENLQEVVVVNDELTTSLIEPTEKRIDAIESEIVKLGNEIDSIEDVKHRHETILEQNRKNRGTASGNKALEAFDLVRQLRRLDKEDDESQKRKDRIEYLKERLGEKKEFIDDFKDMRTKPGLLKKINKSIKKMEDKDKKN